jgi:hypothetical protein
MKNYLFSACLLTCSINIYAACPGVEQPLIIAGENICGSIASSAEKSAKPGEIFISMAAGPDSQLYKLHQHQLNKLSPGIFKSYVDNLKKDKIPVGVAHAISTIKFANDSLPQYANKTFNCATPHVYNVVKEDISKAILLIPGCMLAPQ